MDDSARDKKFLDLMLRTICMGGSPHGMKALFCTYNEREDGLVNRAEIEKEK
jgi:hypothetical protein